LERNFRTLKGENMTDKSIFKGMGYKSLDKQHGGSHYKKFTIQPAEFINENKFLFAEGNAIKYICRHSMKDTLFRNDIRKGLQCVNIQLI
jgi:hypothetical protein